MPPAPDTAPGAPPDAAAIACALRRSGLVPDAGAGALSVHSTKGVSHDHWRIAGTGLLLRIPRLHQWGLAAEDALACQAAAFERAAASGHVPHCRGVLPPDEALPRGALIVDRIDGRAPHLPGDAPAIATALAAIHGLDPEGPPPDPAPLAVHDAPVAATLAAIEAQAAHLDGAGLAAAARAAIAEELAWARGAAAAGEPGFAPCLVGTDTHPGNFLIDRAGRAWFVDLEKAVYGAAPIDLAHATLPTSIGWDPDCTGGLTRAEVRGFYRAYLDRVGPARAAALLPWLLPLRRLTWLRTATWFARWRAEQAVGGAPLRDARMQAHVERHVAARLTPEAIAAARADWLGKNPLTF